MTSPDTARFPRTILPTVCIPWTDDLRIDGPLFQATVRGRLVNGIRVPLRMLPPYRAVTDTAWAGYKAWMVANLPHLLPDAA